MIDIKYKIIFNIKKILILNNLNINTFLINNYIIV